MIQRRRLTNAIFRASDKMYLYTTSVERSAVFGICIAGRITEDQRQRTFLLRMLAHQQQQAAAQAPKGAGASQAQEYYGGEETYGGQAAGGAGKYGGAGAGKQSPEHAYKPYAQQGGKDSPVVGAAQARGVGVGGVGVGAGGYYGAQQQQPPARVTARASNHPASRPEAAPAIAWARFEARVWRGGLPACPPG